MNILFIDEDNSFSSVVAAASCIRCFCRILNCGVRDLRKKEIFIGSKGYVKAKDFVSVEAVQFCQSIGMGILRKRPKLLEGDSFIKDYDIIYAMSSPVKSRLLKKYPQLKQERFWLVDNRSFTKRTSKEAEQIFRSVGNEMNRIFKVAEELSDKAVLDEDVSPENEEVFDTNNGGIILP